MCRHKSCFTMVFFLSTPPAPSPPHVSHYVKVRSTSSFDSFNWVWSEKAERLLPAGSQVQQVTWMRACCGFHLASSFWHNQTHDCFRRTDWLDPDRPRRGETSLTVSFPLVFQEVQALICNICTVFFREMWYPDTKQCTVVKWNGFQVYFYKSNPEKSGLTSWIPIRNSWLPIRNWTLVGLLLQPSAAHVLILQLLLWRSYHSTSNS